MGTGLVPLHGPGALRPNTDSPFQLANAAELTHHFPPQVPYVAGEPLAYHWMVYNHIASARWLTGSELDVLMVRLVPLELMLLTAIAAAGAAVVLSGRSAAAPLAALGVAVAGDLSPWLWTVHPALFTDGPLSFAQMISPTQALAGLLVLPLVAVTAQLLRRISGSPSAGAWFVAIVLITVLAATKATTLPVYGAGLAAVVAYRRLVHGKFDRAAIGLGLLTVAAYAANFIVVLGAETHGMDVAVGDTYRRVIAQNLPEALRDSRSPSSCSHCWPRSPGSCPSPAPR